MMMYAMLENLQHGIHLSSGWKEFVTVLQETTTHSRIGSQDESDLKLGFGPS